MRPDLGPGGYAIVPRPMAALLPEGVRQMALDKLVAAVLPRDGYPRHMGVVDVELLRGQP